MDFTDVSCARAVSNDVDDAAWMLSHLIYFQVFHHAVRVNYNYLSKYAPAYHVIFNGLHRYPNIRSVRVLIVLKSEVENLK